MLTEKQIKTKWKDQHNVLSEAYYAGTSGLIKEEFDTQHGAIWNNLDLELIAAGYKTVPEPPRNLEVEIDELKSRIAALEVK